MKNIIHMLLLAVFASMPLHAQDASLSPYSYFGYGDIMDPQGVDMAAMGHLTFYTDTIHYNFLMPSSTATLKYVNYAVAASFNRYKLSDGNNSHKGSAFFTPYIALGVPFGKAGAGIGFRPYSTSGYLIRTDEEGGTAAAKTGEGGVNNFFFQAAYRPLKGLAVGVGYDYYFGNKVARFIRGRDSVMSITKQIDESVFSGGTFRFSTHYSAPLYKKYFWTAGFMYRFQGRIQSADVSTIQLVDNTYGVQRIVKEVTLHQDTVSLVMPAKLSLGWGMGERGKWFVGVEYEKSFFGAYTNTFFSTPASRFQDGSAFKVGGFWNPDHRVYSKYWKRITYKMGFFTRKGILVLNDHSIDQFGTTFGMSLPMGRFLSNVNVDVEYVNRGTLAAGLIKENIWKIKIGFSFNDKWFIKNKIK
ncbi:MAG: hypothetical protein GXO24_03420 [Chlorobi bacterium]|nr:hypothetical protein [Chlorobiota bacterium]